MLCPTPQILNGTVEDASGDFVQARTNVSFSCNPGYVLSDGNLRQCIVGNSNVTEWDNPLPECQGIRFIIAGLNCHRCWHIGLQPRI